MVKHLYIAVASSLLVAAGLSAHPMGNFSVNHYARIEIGQPVTQMLFVLDLAELPSFELLQKWGLQGTSPPADLQRKAIAESRQWIHQLHFVANNKAVYPVWTGANLVVADGAGGLPVLRVNTRLKLAVEPGVLQYRDETYKDRTAGWKEVVFTAGSGVRIKSPSANSADRSQALTAYPQDPTLSPPQDLTATLEWSGQPVVTSAAPADPARNASAPSPVSGPLVSSAPTAPTAPGMNSLGQVRRGDFLSTALRGKEIGWGLGLVCVAVAFWFGALHALEPGHGKTMVAAYLVGERGTSKHALILGGMVTFTHTVSVFILGLFTLFLSKYVMADVISKWLGIISGLTIVWIGALLFYRRLHALAVAAESGHGHRHSHAIGHRHPHSHGSVTHTHGGSTHRHGIAGEISLKSLLALGASGGLVPCPSALVLLLAAISMGRAGFGLLLLVSFSLGLALVLISTGLLVLYTKRFIPGRRQKTNTFASMLPVISAVFIIGIGLILTGNALGLIPAIRFFG